MYGVFISTNRAGCRGRSSLDYSTYMHCAFITCRKRTDERRFRQPRSLASAVAERFTHSIKTRHDGILCNQHYLVLKRATSSPTPALTSLLQAALHAPPLVEDASPPSDIARVVAVPDDGSDLSEISSTTGAFPPTNSSLADDSNDPSGSPICLSSPAPVLDPADRRSCNEPVTKKRKVTVPLSRSAAMAVTGFRPDRGTVDALRRLQNEHRRLTGNTWNGSSDHLVPHAQDAVIGVTNGEMQQQPFCELVQTLMTHPNIPPHARLQGETQGAEHFWLDIGSGYGLAVLRARIISGAKVCAGIEIAEDRVFISQRLAKEMGMQDRAQFVAADVQDVEVLPILLAATHLFAYSAVFSSATRDYLASVIGRQDSSWLVYVTFDKLDVFTRAGIAVHTEPHGADCRMGGVHLLGRTKPLAMSVSNQALTASILLRCVPPSPHRRDETWKSGLSVLAHRSAVAAHRAEMAHAATLTSLKCTTRSTTNAGRQRSLVETLTARQPIVSLQKPLGCEG